MHLKIVVKDFLIGGVKYIQTDGKFRVFPIRRNTCAHVYTLQERMIIRAQKPVQGLEVTQPI